MKQPDRDAIIRVKQRLSHLFEPNPWVYWSDMLLSAAIGWVAFALALRTSGPIGWTLCMLVSTFALYRALMFTHELEHQPNGIAPGFRGVWHLLIGMPFCLPHFVYRNVHRIHHSRRYYGTAADPEYVPFVAQHSFKEPIRVLVLSFAFPLILALRYLALVPLSLFSTRLRTFVDTKISALALNLDYERSPAVGKERTIWRLEEASTTLFTWCVVGLVAFGQLPLLVVVQWYAVIVLAMTANNLRTFVATHRYESEGAQIGFDDQIYDSLNVERPSLLNALLCPIGTSLHATHHIFPSLPYYALRRAHEALMREIAADPAALGCYVTCQRAHVVPATVAMIRDIAAPVKAPCDAAGPLAAQCLVSGCDASRTSTCRAGCSSMPGTSS
jgi:fatty acid desaturase